MAERRVIEVDVKLNADVAAQFKALHDEIRANQAEAKGLTGAIGDLNNTLRVTGNAQASFVQSLKDQAATIGLNRQQLLEYRAEQLKIRDVAQSYIDNLIKQERAQEEVAASQAKLAASVAQARAANEKQIADGQRLISSYQKQIEVFGLSGTALDRYNAKLLNVSAAFEPLAQKLEELNNRQAEQAAAEQARIAADANSAAVQRSIVASQQEFADGLRQQIVALSAASDETKRTLRSQLEYKATLIGLRSELQPLIDQVVRLTDAQEANDKAIRERKAEAAAAERATLQQKQAVDAYVASLKEELATLGLSKKELREYQLAKLGPEAEVRARPIQQQIDVKNDALAQEATQRADIQSAFKSIIATTQEYIDAGNRLVAQKKDSIATFGLEGDALELHRAKLLSVDGLLKPLIEDERKLREAHEEQTAQLKRLNDENDRIQARYDAAKKSIEEQIKSLKEQTVILRDGADAVNLRKAAEVGLQNEMQEAINNYKAEKKAADDAAKATREKANADKEAENAVKSKAKAQKDYLDRLREEVNTQNLGRRERALYDAQKLNINTAPGSEAANLINQLKVGSHEIDQSAGFIDKFRLNTVGAHREFLVLAHELSQGNFKQFGGSLIVLGERMDIARFLFSTTGVAALAFGGALATVAVLLAKGAFEQERFNQTLLLTGNIAGQTSASFHSLVNTISSATDTTQSNTKELLTGLVATGRYGPQALEAVGRAAANLQRVTGESAEKIIGEFAGMEKGIAEWAVRSNEKYHFLTLADYEYIRSLEEQKQISEAVAFASDRLAAAHDAQREKVTPIVKLYREFAQVLSQIKEATEHLGQAPDPVEKYAKTLNEIELVKKAIKASPGGENYVGERDTGEAQALDNTLGGFLSRFTLTGLALQRLENLYQRLRELRQKADEQKPAADAAKAEADIAAADAKLNEESINSARNIRSLFDSGVKGIELYNRELTKFLIDVANIRKYNARQLERGLAPSSEDVSDQAVLRGIQSIRDRTLNKFDRQAENAFKAEFNQLVEEQAKLKETAKQWILYGEAADHATRARVDAAISVGKLKDITPEQARTIRALADNIDDLNRVLTDAKALAAAKEIVDSLRVQAEAHAKNARETEIANKVAEIERRGLKESANGYKEIVAALTVYVNAKHDAALQRQLAEDARRTQDDIAALDRETEALTQNAAQRRISAAALAIEADARKKIADNPDQEANIRQAAAANLDAITKAINRNYEAQREFSIGARATFLKYAEDAGDAARFAERVLGGSLQKLEDVFVQFTHTGKLSFKDLFQFMADEFQRQFIRMQVKGALEKLLQPDGKAFGFLSKIGDLFFGKAAGTGVPGLPVGAGTPGKATAEDIAKTAFRSFERENGGYDLTKIGTVDNIRTWELLNQKIYDTFDPLSALKVYGSNAATAMDQLAVAAEKLGGVFQTLLGKIEGAGAGNTVSTVPAVAQGPNGEQLITFEQLKKAVAKVESNDNPNAVSPTGAKGRYQVLDSTFRNPGYGITPGQAPTVAEYDRLGEAYLAKMFELFPTNAEAAITAHNQGPGAVQNALAAALRGELRSFKNAFSDEGRTYAGKVLTAAGLDPNRPVRVVFDRQAQLAYDTPQIGTAPALDTERIAFESAKAAFRESELGLRSGATAFVGNGGQRDLTNLPNINPGAETTQQTTDSVRELSEAVGSVQDVLAQTDTATTDLIAQFSELGSKTDAVTTALSQFGPELRDIIGNTGSALSELLTGENGGGSLLTNAPSFFQSLFLAANGGVVGAGGVTPLNYYANGGIADKPQVAVFGEGRMNEAYIPLPDGKNVPVKVASSGGARKAFVPLPDGRAIPVKLDEDSSALAGQVHKYASGGVQTATGPAVLGIAPSSTDGLLNTFIDAAAAIKDAVITFKDTTVTTLRDASDALRDSTGSSALYQRPQPTAPNYAQTPYAQIPGEGIDFDELRRREIAGEGLSLAARGSVFQGLVQAGGSVATAIPGGAYASLVAASSLLQGQGTQAADRAFGEAFLANTYQPGTERGQEYLGKIGEFINQVGVPLAGFGLAGAAGVRGAVGTSIKTIARDISTEVAAALDTQAVRDFFAPGGASADLAAALLRAGAVNPARATGERGVFIGTLGAGNLEAAGIRDYTTPLQEAQALTSAGASRFDVFSTTGLFKGAESKFRFELDDSKLEGNFDTLAKILTEGQGERFTRFINGTPLGSIIEHPELFKAYPNLADLKVLFDNELTSDKGAAGAYASFKRGNPGSIPGVIALPEPPTFDYAQVGRYYELNKESRVLDKDFLESLMHEVQHAVQDIEGFKSGASPEIMGSQKDYLRTHGEIEAEDVARRLRLPDYNRTGVLPDLLKRYITRPDEPLLLDAQTEFVGGRVVPRGQRGAITWQDARPDWSKNAEMLDQWEQVKAKDFNSPEYQAFETQIQTWRKKDYEWKSSVERALSTGDLSLPEARKRAYYPTDFTDEQFGLLPSKLYHVTTAADAVETQGLKTRDELNQRSGLGLGGGASNTISFTTDLKTAEGIQNAMLLAHDFSAGIVTPTHLVDWSRTGHEGSNPFFNELTKSVGGYPDLFPGTDLTAPLYDIVNGTESRKVPKGWGRGEPLFGFDTKRFEQEANIVGESEGGDALWAQIQTDVESARGRQEGLFKSFLALREIAGGPLDPLFFASDLSGLGKVPRDQIQILQFEPNPGAQGYQLGSLREWRTFSGDAVRQVPRSQRGAVDFSTREEAFSSLADAQRGKPESAMLEAQKALSELDAPNANALGYLLEHVGDLTHRMSEDYAQLPGAHFGKEYLLPKLNTAERYLTNPVDRRLFSEIPAIPELSTYSQAHRELETYNPAQTVARNAAVALGEGDFDRALQNIQGLKRAVSSPEWDAIGGAFVPRNQRGAIDIRPARAEPDLSSEAGYLYHATNVDNLFDIDSSGRLKTFRPNYGTDQSSWPDGGLERRAYFTQNAGSAYQFAPEGLSAILRTQQTKDFIRESTGDFFTKKSIPADKLEFLGEDQQWHGLRTPRSQRGALDLEALQKSIDDFKNNLLGPTELLESFKGTFNSGAIDNLLSDVRDPKARSTLTFLSPQQFKELAAPRISQDTLKREARIESINAGLQSEQGLTDIPKLWTDVEQELENARRVVGHEGRHRADAFERLGIDLMPVELRDTSLRWGELGAPDWTGRTTPLPTQLLNEQQSRVYEFPQIATRTAGAQGAGVSPFKTFLESTPTADMEFLREILDERRSSSIPGLEVSESSSSGLRFPGQLGGVDDNVSLIERVGNDTQKLYDPIKESGTGLRVPRGQQGAVDPLVLGKSLNEVKDFLAAIPGIMKDAEGRGLLLFRGSHQSEHPFNEAREGYAVFSSDNPYTASSYATFNRGSSPIVTPFVLRDDVSIREFPKDSRGDFDKFGFDTVARRLGQNQVAVVRDVGDAGPGSEFDYPLFGRPSLRNDQYAFTDPTVAQPLVDFFRAYGAPRSSISASEATTPFKLQFAENLQRDIEKLLRPFDETMGRLNTYELTRPSGGTYFQDFTKGAAAQTALAKQRLLEEFNVQYPTLAVPRGQLGAIDTTALKSLRDLLENADYTLKTIERLPQDRKEFSIQQIEQTARRDDVAKPERELLDAYAQVLHGQQAAQLDVSGVQDAVAGVIPSFSSFKDAVDALTSSVQSAATDLSAVKPVSEPDTDEALQYKDTKKSFGDLLDDLEAKSGKLGYPYRLGEDQTFKYGSIATDQQANNFDLARLVMQAKFPDQLSAFTGTITGAEALRGGADGVYSPKTRDIRVAPSANTFSTASVVDAVDTMLHELQHAQQNTPQATLNKLSGATAVGGIRYNLFSDESNRAQKAQWRFEEQGQALGLPSIGTHAFGRNNESELLATAVANELETRQGINGPFKSQIDKMSEDPAFADFVKRNIRPDLPSLSEPSNLFSVSKVLKDGTAALIPSFDDLKLAIDSLVTNVRASVDSLTSVVRTGPDQGVGNTDAFTTNPVAGFALGGTMTQFGRLPLDAYTTGGITDKPQLALFGEGRMPEAYVPLQDGKTIPVRVKRDGGKRRASVPLPDGRELPVTLREFADGGIFGAGSIFDGGATFSSGIDFANSTDALAQLAQINQSLKQIIALLTAIQTTGGLGGFGRFSPVPYNYEDILKKPETNPRDIFRRKELEDYGKVPYEKGIFDYVKDVKISPQQIYGAVKSRDATGLLTSVAEQIATKYFTDRKRIADEAAAVTAKQEGQYDANRQIFRRDELNKAKEVPAEDTQKVSETTGELTDTFSELDTSVADVSGTFGDVGIQLGDFSTGITDAASSFTGVLGDLGTSITDLGSTLGDTFASLGSSLGDLGGNFGDIFSSLGDLGGGGSGGGDFLSEIASFFFAANGGVMTPRGALPLQAYSRGGIADRPHLALFGEGRMNEAYIPLPDGKNVPVSVRSSGGVQKAFVPLPDGRSIPVSLQGDVSFAYGGMMSYRDDKLPLYAYGYGGIMSSSGNIPLRAYADGGIDAPAAQIALYRDATHTPSAPSMPKGTRDAGGASFSANTYVVVENYGAKVEQREVQRPNGDREVRLLINAAKNEIAADIRNKRGPVSTALRSTGVSGTGGLPRRG